MFNIEEELKKLPKKPGVYIMHDKNDKIIYVGKAINLKRRVTSYFRKTNKNRSERGDLRPEKRVIQMRNQ